MEIARSLEPLIRTDLRDKMVFLAGPRQVGKTTLGKRVLATEAAAGAVTACFSWDREQDRRALRRAEWPAGQAVILLDEIHKYRQWKRWLKGEFDAQRARLRFLVTGSARLDVYRRGGDSLQGRYHHHRLHPFSLAELSEPAGRALPEPFRPIDFPGRGEAELLGQLLTLGGFPEPFLGQSEARLRRWHKERLDRFFREDVRDLEAVRDLERLQFLAELIAGRVGSPLSLNALREDLEISHKAVSHGVEVLARLYHLFLVRPYESRAVRSLKKMPKVYLWDWSQVAEPGARFENLMACHLLKLCHALEDQAGFRASLHYVRDATGREADFLVAVDRKPWFMVEAKVGDEAISKPLAYLAARLEVPQVFQVVLEGRRDFERDGIRVLPAHRFLAALC
jgi:hypothetical protein